MSKFGIQSYWLDGLGDFYNIWYNWHNRNEPAKTIIHIIRKFINKKKSDIKILDCACGAGNPSLALRRMAYNVLSSDGSAKMLKKAKENARHLGIKLNLFCKPILWTDLTKIFPKQKFDAVVCTGNSFCHTSPDGVAIAVEQICSILKPGGVSIVDVKRYSENIKELEYKKEKGWIERGLRVNRRRFPNERIVKFVSKLSYKGQDEPGRRYNIELDLRYDNGQHWFYVFPVWAITSEMVFQYMYCAGLKTQPLYETRDPNTWQYDFCIGIKV